MRTVESVLREIEELRKEASIVGVMTSKIFNDSEVSTYMKETFGVTFGTLAGIKGRLERQAQDLEEKLNKCEVEV